MRVIVEVQKPALHDYEMTSGFIAELYSGRT